MLACWLQEGNVEGGEAAAEREDARVEPQVGHAACLVACPLLGWLASCAPLVC